MKIYIEDYCKNGVWKRKNRYEYSKKLLEDQKLWKEYIGNEFKDKIFLFYYFDEVRNNKLTMTSIAKLLNISRFTLYEIKDGRRKLREKEIDMLYTITFQEEYSATLSKYNNYVIQTNKRVQKKINNANELLEKYKAEYKYLMEIYQKRNENQVNIQKLTNALNKVNDMINEQYARIDRYSKQYKSNK